MSLRAHYSGRAGQGRAGQRRAGQGRAGQGRADLEECIWLVGGLLHGLEQGKMAALVLFNIMPDMGQQHQRQEPLRLRTDMQLSEWYAYTACR